MPKRKWEHDGEDMSIAPRRPSGDWDWAKIKHRHYFTFDGPFVREGPDRGYPIGIGGLHCNRGCGERREGPVCSAWGLDSGRCRRPGKVVDEKFPWGSPTDSRSPPSVEHEGITGWWYCGVHDPERKRDRDRAWRIKFDRGTELRDQRYDETNAASLLVRETIDWEKLESAVEPDLRDRVRASRLQAGPRRAGLRSADRLGRPAQGGRDSMTTKTPELDKMHEVREQSQPIGEFIDWLAGQGILLMRSVPIVHQRWPWQSRYDAEGRRMYGAARGPDDGVHGPPEQYERGEEALLHGESIERMLARFFEIDLNTIEDERRALLEELREANAS